MATLKRPMIGVENQFHNRLLAKAEEINHLIADLSKKPDDKAPCYRIQDICKSMASTCRTLGFKQQSTISNSICLLTENLINQHFDSIAPITENMSNLTKQLIQLSSERLNPNTEINTLQKDFTIAQRCLCVLSDDTDLKSSLIKHTENTSFNAQFYSSIEEIITVAKEYKAYSSAILLDLDDFEVLDEDTLSLLSALPQHVITISENDDFQQRLYAAKLKAKAFLMKPLIEKVLVKNLNFLSASSFKQSNKIMIVHTDFAQARKLERTLKIYGYEVLLTPSYFDCLPNAIEFKPDLVLIAQTLESVAGIDIAAMLNQHDAFNFLTCAILSDSPHDPLAQQAQENGYPCLPFPKDNLSETILMKHLSDLIYKSNRLSGLLYFDHHTGLLTEDRFTQSLNALLSNAQRYNHQISLALLDLDHLGTINETFGYWAGDKVIISLAEMLKNRLRCSDVIGRFNNSRIAIALPNTSIDKAYSLLKNINHNFSQVSHAAPNQSFYSSFSAGISCYPEAGCVNTLLNDSENCLRTAKKNGKNTVTYVEHHTGDKNVYPVQNVRALRQNQG